MCLEDRDCSPESRERREFLFTAIAGSIFVTTAGVSFGAEAPPTHRPADAQLTWKRTVAFLDRHLQG